jgi:diacylglycerol O-acyltransferase
MTTYPMSPVDAAWYHMDGPANLGVMSGLLLTKQALDFDKVRAVYREWLLGFERFRQRVVEVGFPLPTRHWQDMPHFEIDQHLHHIALPAPYDQVALRALVSDLASTPLDRTQPLWQVVVVDDVEGGSALIMRCHHCIADGTVVMHPQQALNTATRVLDGASMLVGELLKTDDPQSPLKGEFRARRQVAWSRPVPLKDIKAIGAQYDAKVNDVLVAAMTGALRSYLRERGVDVNHNTLRAMVPVDLRPPERAGQLGNEFGLVILELAVAQASSTQRLAMTKAGMDALKRSPEAVATRILFDIVGRGPKALEDFSNALFGAKASLVVTNVMGPREVLYLAGVPIDRMISWAPHPGELPGHGDRLRHR